MSSRATLTATPADILSYQNELIRTKNYRSVGRMNKIAIGPSANWTPPPHGQDPFIDKFGRLIDLRNRFLAIATSPDESMLLVPSRMVALSMATDQPVVGLPDVPDPTAKPQAWNPEDMGYRADGTPLNEKFPGQPAGWTPAQLQPGQRTAPMPDRAATRMLPQRLEDRAERVNGRLATLEGTNFLVFQPVLVIAFQPEVIVDGHPQLQAEMWTIRCVDDAGQLLLDSNGQCATLLVDPRTGETHFFGGVYNIVPNIVPTSE
jgi:hypothetical protein